MDFRLALLFCFLFSGFMTEPVKSQDSPVPVVKFTDLQKRLNSNSDSVFVINFWATWCAPCRKELPAFEKIYQDYSNKKVKVLLVSLDFPGQAQKSLKTFL